MATIIEKAAAVIPIKTNNQRLPGKNTRILGGKPLWQHLFDEVASNTMLDEVFVDSSDAAILAHAVSYGFTPILRPEQLNSSETSGHDLLNFELPHINQPIIAQLFVTLPFLRNTTINQAIAALRAHQESDSVLAVFEVYNRFWFAGKPVNHTPELLTGTQYQKPAWCEAGFYVFRRDAFLREQSRVTKKHLPMLVDRDEVVDIDTETDFFYAGALYSHRTPHVS